MCETHSVPFKLISVEPSPQVFCELDVLAEEQKWDLPDQDMQAQDSLRLNIALSNTTGYLTFTDPGNEGGSLVGGTNTELGPVTANFLQNVTKCSLSKDANHTIDPNRVSVVPTFTMDILVSSALIDLRIVGPNEDVFILKIDTEGNDVRVVRGAGHALANVPQ
jgi:hypothetical protein